MGRSQPQVFTMKHGNMIAKEHFKKYWQRYVKTWFDQPAKKKARRLARQQKAAAIAPRPVAGSLRSVVHRRRNKSVEGQEANVQRLRDYRSKLVVFPKHAKKATKGWVDTTAADTVVEQVRGKVMPAFAKAPKSKARA